MSKIYKKRAITLLSVITAGCAALAAGFAVANFGQGAVAHADVDAVTETIYWGFDEDSGELVIHDGTNYEDGDFTDSGSFAGTQAFNMSNSPWSGKDITSATVEGDVAPLSTANWFYGFTNLETVDLSGLDTSNVTNMSSMFTSCRSLTEIDFSGWDTANVTDMSGMFVSCAGLTELNVSELDTSSVTQMSYMFSSCNGLTELDLSGWDTSNVTNMSGMFSNSSGLTSLDLSGWDTSSVTTASGMFYGLPALESISISDELATTMGERDTGLSVTLYLDCATPVAPSGGLYEGLDAGTYFTSVHHELSLVDAEPATCSTRGNIEYYLCDVCEKTFSDEEGTTEISDVSTPLDPNNHTWGDWQEVTAATCSSKGSEARSCGGCTHLDTRETDIDPDNHRWEHVDGKEPTETEDGYTAHEKCSLCDETKDKEVIPATGGGSGSGTTGGNTGSGSTSFAQSNSMNNKTMLILLAVGVGVVTLMAVFALILAIRKKTEGAAADDDGFYDDYRE